MKAVTERLAQMPLMGRACEFEAPSLRGLRVYGLPGFASYLVFYRASGTTLLVVRILHGARDLVPVLLEPPPERE